MQTNGTRALTRICLLAMLVGVADAATLRDLKPEAFKQDRKLDATLSVLAEEAGVLTRTQQAQTSAMQKAAGRLARLNPAGAVQVYVRMRPGFPPIEPVLSAAGLQIELVNTKLGIVQGWIAPEALEALSQASSVSRVTVPDYAFTRTGSVNTEGDVLLRAHDLRAAGITGMGVKVGVISDGADSRGVAQASGDLPVVTTQTFAGSGDEGTAMLEIIHDLAPGAELGFCGPATDLEFIDCVQDLQTTFAADIIVDDLGFLLEPYFEDGDVADAVQIAATTGVDYVSAAGNSADGGYYEADFEAGPGRSVDYGPPLVMYNAQHDFVAGAGQDLDQTFNLTNGDCVRVVLQWNNPFGSAADDYDLVLLGPSDNVLAASIAPQDGPGPSPFDDPVEGFDYQHPGPSQTVRLKVLRFSTPTAPPQRLKMVMVRGAGPGCGLSSIPFQYSMAAGSIFGHPAVPAAIAVGTINVFQPGLNVIAPYSSQGPVRIDFPGPVTLRPKPDVTGVDCGSITGAGGFGQPGPGGSTIFCGTSAAAPHVAGVLALLKSTGVGNAADELRNTAVDLGAAGRDNVYGFGRVNAVLAARELVLLATIDNPTADITIAPGQSLNFQSTCTDDPMAAVPDPAFTFAWDFDGGTPPDPSDTSEDPGARTFSTLGTFTVTLICTNANGTSTAERTITVTSAGGGGDGGGGGGGGCFIATAAYGSYLHPRVQVLRDFRDQYLMTNVPGRAFVQWYYRTSPPIAAAIAENEGLRLVMRGLLTPVVYIVQYPGLGAGLLLLGVIGLRGYRRVLRPETNH